jgi:signal transduction histidine kinase
MEERKILIVDDEAEIRKLISAFFAKAGYKAVAVESALLGLNILVKEDFSVLVSDIKMPYMDGIEFCRRVKKLRPDMVIVVLTGYGELDTAQEAIRIGVHDYLTKPVDLVKLQESVEQGLKQVEEKRKDVEYYFKIKKEAELDKQRLDSMKDEFMTLISHELRTPVTVISENLSLLRDSVMMPEDKEVLKLSDEQKKDLISGMDKGRRRLIGVIDDISYYMRLTKSGVKLNKSRVALNKFLEQNFDGLKHLIPSDKFTLKKDFIQEELTADIDKERFLDVLSRLINNSIQHNLGGAEIVLRLSSEKNFVRIEVCDNGQGFPREILDNIFTSFSVGDIMHHGKGIGLGLSISKKVVELHGGRISVASQEGKGARVTIELPTA